MTPSIAPDVKALFVRLDAAPTYHLEVSGVHVLVLRSFPGLLPRRCPVPTRGTANGVLSSHRSDRSVGKTYRDNRDTWCRRRLYYLGTKCSTKYTYPPPLSYQYQMLLRYPPLWMWRPFFRQHTPWRKNIGCQVFLIFLKWRENHRHTNTLRC